MLNAFSVIFSRAGTELHARGVSFAEGFAAFVSNSKIAKRMKATKNLGTSFRVTVCELYVIPDHVHSLYLAKADLLTSQDAVANKPVDIVHLAVKQHSRFLMSKLSICVFNDNFWGHF